MHKEQEESTNRWTLFLYIWYKIFEIPQKTLAGIALEVGKPQRYNMAGQNQSFQYKRGVFRLWRLI